MFSLSSSLIHENNCVIIHYWFNRISEEDIMELDLRGLQCVLCTGEAGSGKSTLSKRMVSLWARGKLSTPFWSRTKMVIYLTPADEENNLTQTMRNAIPGKKAYKDLMMDLYTDEPESVLVIIEGFNEFQNVKVITEITQLLRDQATNVFLTVRNGAALLTSDFRKSFHQSVEIKGFSDDQSETYTRKLLKELQHKRDCIDKIDDFFKAVKNKPKVWNSPLNLSLACLLYIEGEIQPSEMAELTEVSLYAMRENRMVERELLEHNLADIQSIAKSELSKIHKLAIYLMVTNNTKCTGDDLKLFKIQQNSPVLVLLDKEERFSAKHGQSIRWTWPHSRLHEFDAATCLTGMEYLTDSHWLYWIASRPILNPVTKLVAAILGNDNRYEDVKALTTLTTLLQTTTECSVTTESEQTEKHQCAWIDNWKQKSHSDITLDSCFSDGELVIQQCALDLPDLSLLCECRGSLFNGNVSLFKHIQECWKVGNLYKNENKYILSSENILLPALDRLVRFFVQTYIKYDDIFTIF